MTIPRSWQALRLRPSTRAVSHEASPATSMRGVKVSIRTSSVARSHLIVSSVSSHSHVCWRIPFASSRPIRPPPGPDSDLHVDLHLDSDFNVDLHVDSHVDFDSKVLLRRPTLTTSVSPLVVVSICSEELSLAWSRARRLARCRGRLYRRSRGPVK